MRLSSLILALFASAPCLAQPLTDDPLPARAPAEEMGPPTTDYQRIERRPVLRKNAWWVQPKIMASPFDARRDIFLARWSPGVTAGRRWSRWGFFGQLEYDQTFDFSLDGESLHVMNVGVGAELLNFLGHLRSTLAVGASILMDDTAIDEAGETGVYLDLNPAALRWGFGGDYAVEFAPLGLDIIIPVTHGVPLVIYSYGTTLSFEWAIQ